MSAQRGQTIVTTTPPVLTHKGPSFAHVTQAILATVKRVLVSKNILEKWPWNRSVLNCLVCILTSVDLTIFLSILFGCACTSCVVGSNLWLRKTIWIGLEYQRNRHTLSHRSLCFLIFPQIVTFQVHLFYPLNLIIWCFFFYFRNQWMWSDAVFEWSIMQRSSHWLQMHLRSRLQRNKLWKQYASILINHLVWFWFSALVFKSKSKFPIFNSFKTVQPLKKLFFFWLDMFSRHRRLCKHAMSKQRNLFRWSCYVHLWMFAWIWRHKLWKR